MTSRTAALEEPDEYGSRLVTLAEQDIQEGDPRWELFYENMVLQERLIREGSMFWVRCTRFEYRFRHALVLSIDLDMHSF